MVRTAAFSASLMVLLLLASTLIFYSPHTVAATTSPRILLLDLGTPEAAGALQLINMSFVKVSSSQFLTTDLNMFDLLFVGWDGNFATNPAAFAALTTRQGDIANWVASGHGVVALAEPNIGHFTWLPLSVNITEENADPVAITNPSHPVMANLTDALLSGWGNSYHNYFTSWNTAYQVLATTPLHGLPVTLAATLGSGRIAITGQDPDWHLFNQGRPGAAILLRNMVKWAGGVSQTVLKNTSLSVSPIVSTVSKGSSFSVGINVANVSNLYSFHVIVTFDPSLLTASPPTDFGNVLRNYCSKTSGCSGVSSQFTSGPGFVEGNESLVGTVPGFTGNGTVYTVQLTAAKGGAGTSAIHIASNASGGGNGNLASATGLAIQHFSIDGIFSDDGPDLFVSIVPNLLSLGSGATATSRVTLYSLNGLTGTVALSLSGVPAGVSGVLGQTALSLNGTSASTTLKITVGATVVAGTSPVTITGTITLKAQTIARSSSLQLTILSAPPDFSISVTRASVVIPVGGAGSVNVTVTSVNGFNAPITLSLQGLALGGEATSAFNIDPVTPAAGSSASSKLTIFVSQFAFPATIPLTVTGASAGLTHTASVILQVSTFNIIPIVPGLFPINLQPGQSESLPIEVNSINGFTGTVQLTTLNVPSNVTASLSPSTVTLLSGSSAMLTLTLQVGSQTQPGTFIMFVIGTSGPTFVVGAVALSIRDFSITLANGEVALPVTGSVVLPVFLASLNNFAGNVTLRVSGAPTGVMASITPSSLGLIGGTTSVAQLTVTATSLAAAGDFDLIITAINGPTVHSATLRLQITDFSISVAPSSLAVSPRQTARVSIALSALNGFSSPVTLSIVGLPTGVTATLSTGTVVPNGSSTLTLTVGNKPVLGTFTITVIAVSGSLTRTATLTITITK